MIEDTNTGIIFVDPSTVEMIPVSDLKIYKRNAKKHTPEQIDQIINSIKAFGMNDPIGIWGKDNIIVEGHGRFLALQKMGETGEVPCIRLDHLTDEQRRAYALAHNQLTMTTGFEDSILLPELEALEDIYDMSDFGFDLDDSEESAPAEVVEDDTPELDEVEPVCKRGQIWRLGSHRLMCGDSTSADDVARLMNGEKAELALTDPPYGISAVHGVASDSGGDKPVTIGKAGGGGQLMFKKSNPPTGTVGGGKIVKAHIYEYIQGDDTTETARKSYEIMRDISENQIIFGGNYFTDFLYPSPCWCIWDKQNTGNFADVEMAWTSFGKGAKLYQWLWNGLSRKGDRKTELVSRVHPTQKPVGVLGAILQDFSKEGDSVLDLFGGSGSTLIACEQLDRSCFMMEISPRYCDVIIKRWEDFTGQTAVLEEAYE